MGADRAVSTAETGEERLVALVRFSGEISLKAKATRRQFIQRLVRNLKDAMVLEGIPARIDRAYDRILVELEDRRGLEVLARLFGVQSVSLARCRPFTDLDEVVRVGTEIFRDAVRDRHFAVRARLVGGREDVSWSPRELERVLGTALLPEARGVNLSHPDFTARVEVYQGRTYFVEDTLDGPAGLPCGSEGRAVALVSGGFDSAVAAWQLLKRGLRLDYVFCNLGGRSHELGVLRVMKVLADDWCYGHRPRLHALDFEPVTRQLQERTHPRYWQVLLKRYMLRAAEAVARDRHADAIVTGEALGQVSSQTLKNLSVISGATKLPILRPLLGFNKDEIIRLAEHIGTAPLSAVVAEYCAMVPRRPATAARLEVVLGEEAKIEPSVLEEVLAGQEILDLQGIEPDARVVPELVVDEIPAGAVVIDLRTRAEYEAWHHPEALHLEFRQAWNAFPSFGKDQAYVLYCEVALKSAHLAEVMRAQGFSAHHFRGGSKRLRRLLEQGRGRRSIEPSDR